MCFFQHIWAFGIFIRSDFNICKLNIVLINYSLKFLWVSSNCKKMIFAQKRYHINLWTHRSHQGLPRTTTYSCVGDTWTPAYPCGAKKFSHSFAISANFHENRCTIPLLLFHQWGSNCPLEDQASELIISITNNFIVNRKQ